MRHRPSRNHSLSLLLLIPLLLSLLLSARPISAHPFGSRFLAHLVVVKLEPNRIQLDYTVEIPTSIIMREFYNALKGREPSKEEDARFTQEKLAYFLKNFRVSLDGQPLTLVQTNDPKARNGVGNMNFFTYHLLAEVPWVPEVGNTYTLKLENLNYSDYDPLPSAGGTGGTQPIDPRDRRGMQDGGSYFSSQLWASDAVKVEKASVWEMATHGAAVDAAGSWFANPAMRELVLELKVLAPTGSAAIALNPVSTAQPGAPDAAAPAAGGKYTPQVEGVPLLNYLNTGDQGLGVMLMALLMALFFGGAHALSPGHGKALVAAYLIGNRGTIKHALWLGLSVTVAHTSSVIMLGLVTLFASQYILPETLEPYLGVVSGVSTVGIGLFLLRDRWRLRSKGLMARQTVSSAAMGGESGSSQAPAELTHSHSHVHPHGHSHGEEQSTAQPHEHPHSHGADLAHFHPPQPVAEGSQGERWHSHWREPDDHTHDVSVLVPDEVSLKQLIRLGFVGGMVPCPTATVVLLTAIALKRIEFGLALVLAFSVGLAAVLVAIGIAMVLAGSYLKRFSGESRLMRYLPVASALMVTLLGGVITVNAVQGLSSSSTPAAGMVRPQP